MGDNSLLLVAQSQFKEFEHPIPGNGREGSSEKTQSDGRQMALFACFKIGGKVVEACGQGLARLTGLQVLGAIDAPARTSLKGQKNGKCRGMLARRLWMFEEYHLVMYGSVRPEIHGFLGQGGLLVSCPGWEKDTLFVIIVV